jgi:hypothetical protein
MSIGRNVVYFGSPSCSLPYNNSPPYLCFHFIGGWYTYNRSHIICGFYFFMIVTKVFNIRVFNVANEMCSLIITWVRPLYIIPSCFSFFLTWVFVFCGYWWDPNHSLNHLWLRFFMRILGWYLLPLCLQIFRQLLRCFHCAMCNVMAICFIQCFHL